MIKYVKLLIAIVAISVTDCHALSSGQVTVSNTSGPHFYSDDGNCGTNEVPLSAYVIIQVLNTSSSDTLHNIAVKMTSNSNLAAGFKLLSHTSDSTIIIPRVLPNDSAGAYFYIQHPCTKNLSVTFDFTLSDANTGSVTFSTTITTQDVGPAAAGGDIVRQEIAGIDALGVLVADTVTYQFGNYNGGHMYFQPSGDTLFPADNMELIGSNVLSSPFSACGGPAAGDHNLLYYNGTGCGAGSGNDVIVVYYYLSSLFNQSCTFKPYAGMKSGGPTKYLSNYGSGVALDTFVTTPAANKFTINKTASCGICTAGDTVTYTVTISNSASVDLMFDKMLDSLPAGHTYVGFAPGSDITDVNASDYPAAGATGNITFTGLIPEATFPYRSFVVPANDSISLKYLVELPGTGSNDLFNNRAIGQVGYFKLDTAFALTCAGCSALPITLIYFNGHVVGQTNKIVWETGMEVNNAGFDLYRLSEGVNTTWLEHIPSGGNSFNRQAYSAIDNNPTNQSHVYKLEQRDFDGNSSVYYTTVKRTSQKQTIARIFPNPANDKLFIASNDLNAVVEVRMYTLTGKVIQMNALTPSDNTEQVLSIATLKAGTYFVELITEYGAPTIAKLIKL